MESARNIGSFSAALRPVVIGISICILAYCVFFALFPFPPLVDIVGHIGLTLLGANDVSGVYQITPNITYKGLFWLGFPFAKMFQSAKVIGFVYQIVAFGMFALTALSMLHLLGRCSAGRLLLLLVLIFPFLHSKTYVWGMIPFCLSVWSALAATMLFAANFRSDPPTGRTAIIANACSICLMVLSPLFHPIGIPLLLLMMGGVILAALFFLRQRIFILLYGLVGLSWFLILYFSDKKSSGAESFMSSLGSEFIYSSYGFGFSMGRRFWALLTGQSFNFWGISDNVLPAPIIALLGLTPFIALCLLEYSFRRRHSFEAAFAFVLVLIALLCAFFGPEHLFKVIFFPSRVLGMLSPVVFGVLVAFLPNVSRWLSVLLVVLVVPVFFILYSPLYMAAQEVDSEASALASAIVRRVEESGKTSPVLLDYERSRLGFHLEQFHLLPLLAASNQRLLNQKVYLLSPWRGDVHLPVQVNTRVLENAAVKEGFLNADTFALTNDVRIDWVSEDQSRH